jgi:hypothetical protein
VLDACGTAIEGVEMTIATLRPVQSGSSDLQGELRHVRDLVFVRRLLGERGATPAELREYDAVVGAARARLAESALRASADYAPAA